MECSVAFGGLLFLWFTVWAKGFDDHQAAITCKNVVWLSHQQTPLDRVNLCWNFTQGVNWYGGGTKQSTAWPMQSDTSMMDSATTGARDSSSNSIHSRFWMNTAGQAIIVHDDVPLFVDVNEFSSQDKFCLEAFNGFPYHYPANAPLKLSFAFCEAPQADNMTDFYLSLRRTFFRLPVAIPDEQLFRLPIWSMPTKYFRPTSSDILTYATNISKFVGLFKSDASLKGLIHIQRWQVCDGSFEFISSNIAHPKSLFAKLITMGFSIALHVQPFLKEQCNEFKEAHQQIYLVLDSKTREPVAGTSVDSHIIDFTNDQAVEWWLARLHLLQEKYNISSFFFDDGMSSHLPHGYVLNNSPTLQPDIFTTRYAEAAATFGRLGIIESAWQTQHLPNFVRGNKLFSIGMDEANSLKGVIPNILLIGLLGYPFVMPDVIGGTYDDDKLPEVIVYIRWLQLSTFLPALHFSVGPWEYGPLVVDIATDMMQRRVKFEDYLVALARQATIDGSPIIRPLWWSTPNDATAQIIADQFLVGDKLLVAPVIDTSTEQHDRDIYLPDGTWRDENNPKQMYDGPTWLRNYSAPLTSLPYFSRV